MWVASAPKYFEIGAEIFGTVGTRLPGDAKTCTVQHLLLCREKPTVCVPLNVCALAHVPVK